MHELPVSAIQAIQAILTPAVGISAVGLMLLGASNRYSSIVNRIRLLNDEKRRLAKQLVSAGELGFTDQSRFMSIRKQLEELLSRSGLVRNAILSFQGGILCFVLSSITIGINLLVNAGSLMLVPFTIFIAGMICLFCGVSFAAVEVHRSYKIILIEVKADE